ncbi:hypothetical protein [Methanosarcina horonobensis]|uniref:hypothetical protein n=1 Tax=Methanosarcina horonobensis TaxID=418008 RepID=UPI000AB73376|nr:hypothetical protein [Methanosarcina horonobensis]
MSTFDIRDDEINAKEVLERIRENIQSRKKTGAYSEPILNSLIKNSEKKNFPCGEWNDS